MTAKTTSCDRQTLAAGLLLLGSISVGAQEAIGELDQFQIVGENNSVVAHSTRSVGQTWTVRRPGRLSAIELSLAIDGDDSDQVRIDILDASTGYMPEMILGSVFLARSELGPMPVGLSEDQITATQIRLTDLDIVVVPEDILGVRLTTEVELPDLVAAGWLRESVGGADSYPDGELFINGSPLAADLVFKTFVQEVDEIFDNGFE